MDLVIPSTFLVVGENDGDDGGDDNNVDVVVVGSPLHVDSTVEGSSLTSGSGNKATPKQARVQTFLPRTSRRYQSNKQMLDFSYERFAFSHRRQFVEGGTGSGGGRSGGGSSASLYGRCKELQTLQDLLARSTTKATKETRGDNQVLEHVDDDDDGLTSSFIMSVTTDAENKNHNKDRSSDGDNNPSSFDRCFVLLEGISGTGKSVLAGRMQDYVTSRKLGGLYVRGKCDIPSSSSSKSQASRNNQPLSSSYGGNGGVDHAEPLSAIKSCIIQLYNQILSSPTTSEEGNENNDDTMQALKAKLAEELVSLIPLLSRFIPNLLLLTESQATSPTAISSASTATQNMQGKMDSNDLGDGDGVKTTTPRATTVEEFNYAVRKLLQVITKTYGIPLVCVCDDLQWSDPASLDVIKAWLTDVNTKGLMIVGCYRTDQEGLAGANPMIHNNLFTMIKELTLCKKERALAIERIKLDNWTVDDLKDFLTDLLSTSSSVFSATSSSRTVAGGGKDNSRSTKSLAEVLHKKTNGNPYHLKRYLQELVKEGLLSFNVGTTEWVWDENAIRSFAVSEHVAELMKSQLTSLGSARRVLPIAACLGSTFSTSILQTIMENHHDNDSLFSSDDSTYSSRLTMASDFLSNSFNETLLHDDLRQCEEEGLIERCSHSDMMVMTATRSANASSFSQPDHLGKGGNDGNHCDKGDSATEISYSFVHDKVQEAALALLPDEDFVKFRVGEILWRTATSEKETEARLFEIIGLLSCKIGMFVHYDDKNVKGELARLYHAGGKKAQAIAAFRSACDYFKVAVELMSVDDWFTDRDFCLDVYSSAAESEYSSGRYEQMQIYISRVLQLQDCPPVNKLRIYYVQLDSLTSSNDRRHETVDFAVYVLNQLGCHLPTSRSAIILKTITGLISTKRLAAKVTPEFVDNLPVSNDPIHIGIMTMLDAFTYPCYSQKPELMGLLCIEMNRRTLKHGITPYAAYSFSFLAWIYYHLLGDLQGGRKLIDHAFAVLGKYSYKKTEPKTLFIIYSAVWHWSNPLQNCMQEFYTVYEKGMRVGDCQTALMSIYSYLECAFIMGRNLESIDVDCVNYINQAVDYKQETVLNFLKIQLQAVRNLRLRSSNTTTLTGSVLNEAELVERCKRMNDKFIFSQINKRKLMLACYFGDFEFGANFAITNGDQHLKKIAAQATVPVNTFNLALCCYAMARRMTGKRRTRFRQYRAHAKKYHSMIKKWSPHNPNCVHYLLMLDAEHSALHGKIDASIEKYEKAIIFTGRSGLINDGALANERLASVFLEEKRNSVPEAKLRLARAIELFTEWKAMSKVRKLKKFMEKTVI